METLRLAWNCWALALGRAQRQSHKHSCVLQRPPHTGIQESSEKRLVSALAVLVQHMCVVHCHAANVIKGKHVRAQWGETEGSVIESGTNWISKQWSPVMNCEPSRKIQILNSQGWASTEGSSTENWSGRATPQKCSVIKDKRRVGESSRLQGVKSSGRSWKYPALGEEGLSRGSGRPRFQERRRGERRGGEEKKRGEREKMG